MAALAHDVVVGVGAVVVGAAVGAARAQGWTYLDAIRTIRGARREQGALIDGDDLPDPVVLQAA